MPQSWPSSWINLYIVFILMFFMMVVFMYFSTKTLLIQTASNEKSCATLTNSYFWSW
nr:ATP synthase F0 subunit 8 [Eurycercus lamellatus]